jgi:ubiquinone/menaquinone biosynthesis C-methylase UbiE
MVMGLRKLATLFVGCVLAVGLTAPAAAQLGSRSAEEWIKTLESPARVAGLKIPETLAALKIKPGQLVADIGAGTGVFTFPFVQSVRPGGKVYAVDVEQGLLDHITEKATEQGMSNYVNAVLGEFTDPGLPENIDLAFINDVLHHIEDRPGYLKSLAGYLKPGGRIAVIDFRTNMGGHRNQPELQTPQELATKWMAAVGLKPLEEINLFEDKWFVIYGK